MASDEPEILEAICAAAGGAKLLRGLFPDFLPFRKGENFREKFPKAIVIWESIFRTHDIPPILFKWLRNFFNGWVALDRHTCFCRATKGMCFRYRKEKLPAVKGRAGTTRCEAL